MVHSAWAGSRPTVVMHTADGDAQRDEPRTAAKRRRRLSERERQALRAATVRPASRPAAGAVAEASGVTETSDELAAAWASADAVPATQMAAMMSVPEVTGLATGVTGAGDTAEVAVPVGDFAVAEVRIETQAAVDVVDAARASGDAQLEPALELEALPKDAAEPTPQTSSDDAAGAVAVATSAAEGTSLPSELGADGADTGGDETAEPTLLPEARLAAIERVEPTEAPRHDQVDPTPIAETPTAPELSPRVGEGSTSGTSQVVETAPAAAEEQPDALEEPAATAAASDGVAPDPSTDNAATATLEVPTSAAAPLADPPPETVAAPVEAESIVVPAEIFAFAEMVEPEVAELADAQEPHTAESAADESIGELSEAAQVEASRVADASAAEDVAAMAAIVAAANTDAPTVHEVSLDALEEALTVDESAPPPNHGTLTISEAELSALAEPAAPPDLATVDTGREPEVLESIPAAPAAMFTESEPAPDDSTDLQAAEVATASEFAALVAALDATPVQGEEHAATDAPIGSGDLNPTVLAELTRVQEALREVLEAAPPAEQNSAEIHVLKSQLEGLAAEVQSLRAPVPVEPAATPRQQFVIAAEHLLLVGGGFAMLAWSLASLFSGNQTKLTLLGVIAANLAFAAAILRSGRGTR
jgi:hypothetical protein